MATWAKAVIQRDQARIFYPTLEEMVAEDHPIRFFDELLQTQDWQSWEQDYDRHRGQPPIHPRLMAGAIVYGLTLRLRSSRQVEDACSNRLDFMWLLSGRRIDHSTIAKFRTAHEAGLIELFKGLNLVARQLGHISLTEVATDGTRIQADSSRYGTAGKAKIENWLAGIEAEMRSALAVMALQDEADDQRFGADLTPSELPPELKDLGKRRELLQRALAAVEEVERRREAKHEVSAEKVAKVPVSDPDSRVLPNKESGFSPNYTPVITVDGQAGLILAAEVTNSTAEAEYQTQAAEEIEQVFGQPPQTMLGDGLFRDLENLRQLEEKGIRVLTPVHGTGAGSGDVAYRPDPSQAVAEALWEKLPRTKQGRLTREAFQFDAVADCFYCPRGRRLGFVCLTSHRRSDGEVYQTRKYRAVTADCRGCALRDHCIPPSQNYRRVERMEGSEVLDRVAELMSRPENQRLYARRRIIAETPFGHIKQAMGIRRFLHRGIKKVQTEWRWICTAYNLSKLIRLIRASRIAVSGKVIAHAVV